MTRLPRSIPSLVVVTLILAACAAESGESPDPSRPVRTEPPLETIPPSDEPIIGEVPAEIMAALVADASDRTGLDAEAIEVVQAEAVTWNDGSLGCPEPGMFYTQALVDGYHVILEADGEKLDYRVSAAGGFHLCEKAPPGG
jgi:hypothetical protein